MGSYLNQLETSPESYALRLPTQPYSETDFLTKTIVQHYSTRSSFLKSWGIKGGFVSAQSLIKPLLLPIMLWLVPVLRLVFGRWRKSLVAALEESELELSSWAMATIGEAVSAGEYTKHLNFIHQQTRKVASFFEKVDVLVTPTAAMPPVKIGAFALSASGSISDSSVAKNEVSFLDRQSTRLLSDKKPFVRPPTPCCLNQTGQPALTVPLYWNSDKLPIGTQLVAAAGQELRLLQLARQLEQLHPWSDRRPSLVSSQ